jgi:hypothetical protein
VELASTLSERKGFPREFGARVQAGYDSIITQEEPIQVGQFVRDPL